MSQSDEQILARYRARFASGPVGTWATVLGAGWDIEYGWQFEFRPDGTGRVYAYDASNEEEPESEQHLTWRAVGPGAIDVQPVGEAACAEDWGVIRYDFRFALSRYGGERRVSLCNVSPPATDEASDEPGFWWAPLPVVLTEEL